MTETLYTHVGKITIPPDGVEKELQYRKEEIELLADANAALTRQRDAAVKGLEGLRDYARIYAGIPEMDSVALKAQAALDAAKE